MTVSAQDISPTEVTVTESFTPTIPEAYKIKEITDFLDTTKLDKTQEYNFIEKMVYANYKSRPLVSAKITKENLSDLYQYRISLGFGSQYTTEFNGLFNSLRESNYSYGALLSHFNNNFKIDEKEAGKSANSIHLYGKKIGEQHILMGTLEYDRKNAYSYGHVDNMNSFSESSLDNPFIYTRLSISAVSKELGPDQLKYSTSCFVSDLNDRAENRVHFNASVSKDISGYPLNIDLEIDHYSHSNGLTESLSYYGKNLQTFVLSPSISLNKFDIDFDLGFGIDYESDGALDIFPLIVAKKDVVDDILSVSFGVQDDKYRNTYKTLSDLNPYIHAMGINQSIDPMFDTVQDLRITEIKEIFFEISNVLGPQEFFKGGMSIGYVENLPSFQNNYFSDVNRFLVHYNDVWQVHADLNYNWQLNNLIGIHINAEYYDWYDSFMSKSDDFLLPHKANIQLDGSVSVNLQEKIKLYPSISFLSGREVLDANMIDAIVLDPQYHANLYIDYNYTKSLSAYLRINNLTNSQKYIWSGYREIGINSVFGLTYSF